MPSIVVLGDLENEGNNPVKNLDWTLLPQNINEAKQYAPDLVMMFLFAKPDKLDVVKEKLSPVLGEKNLIISTEETVDKVNRKFLSAVGR